MCSRYVTKGQAAMERAFSVVKPWWRFEASHNVAPTQSVPVVRLADGEREGVIMRWGIIPYFAKGIPPKYSTINARIETVETAASDRGPWKRGQRCIQVASRFYEWHISVDGRKHPYFIQVSDQDVFGFAALWDQIRCYWTFTTPERTRTECRRSCGRRITRRGSEVQRTRHGRRYSNTLLISCMHMLSLRK